MTKGYKKQRLGISLNAVGFDILFFYGFIHCTARSVMTMQIRTKRIFAIKQICVLSCLTSRTRLPGVLVHKISVLRFLDYLNDLWYNTIQDSRKFLRLVNGKLKTSRRFYRDVFGDKYFVFRG